MHHLACFTSSIAQNAVLANVSAVVDEILTLFTTTTYTYSQALRIMRLYAFGDSVTQVRLDSPLIRLIGPPQIMPVDTGAEPSTLPPINMPDGNGLVLQPNDPLSVLISRTGAGASTCKILLWMATGPLATISGAVRRVRATAAVTLTQTGWTSGALTFDQALPAGDYEVVGMAAQGANLFAGRLIMPGQVLRPGVLAQDSAGEQDWPNFAWGNFGSWGRFKSWAPPTAQFMGFGAGAAQEVWLDLIPRQVPGIGIDFSN